MRNETGFGGEEVGVDEDGPGCIAGGGDGMSTGTVDQALFEPSLENTSVLYFEGCHELLTKHGERKRDIVLVQLDARA